MNITKTFIPLTNNKHLEKLQIPTGRIPLVIDTDAKNETDDQFAIAWALLAPERFDVQAIYAAPFSYDCIKPGIPNWESHPNLSKDWTPKKGMLASYEEIKHIYSLLSLNPKGKVFYGADCYMTEHNAPVESEAVTDLIQRVRASQQTLYIAAIGAITNIASAILLAPDIIDKIVVVWLGGELPESHNGMEFNMMQDVLASQAILNCGVPLIWIPCRKVASSLTLSRRETEEVLAKKNPLCDYLADLILDAMNMDEDWENKSHTPESTRIVWDIATIAALALPDSVTTKLIHAPVLNNDFTLEESESRHMIRMATSCDRDMIFHAMYKKLLNAVK